MALQGGGGPGWIQRVYRCFEFEVSKLCNLWRDTDSKSVRFYCSFHLCESK